MKKEKLKLDKKITSQNAVTLIGLIITIIILLILAVVTINLTLGENGIFKTAKNAKDEYIKAQLKEELEIEIVNIQAKKIEEGKKFEREDLRELVKIGAEIESYGIPIEGEYKNYYFEIDENNKVIIGNKEIGEKPTIKLTKNTDETVETVIIKVEVSIKEGAILLVTKPDGTTTTETTFEYNVTDNDNYIFIAEGSNGRKSKKSIQISNVKIVANQPVIVANKFRPIIKESGVELIGGTVSITYDTKKGLENYYSIDNGVMWSRYEGPFDVVKTGKVLAKSELNGETLSEASYNVEIQDSYLGTSAYDENKSTYYQMRKLGSRETDNEYILVDSSAYGKTLKLKFRALCPASSVAKIWAYDNEGKILGYLFDMDGTSDSGITTLDFSIPQNTVGIQFYEKIGWGSPPEVKIYEISIVDN